MTRKSKFKFPTFKKPSKNPISSIKKLFNSLENFKSSTLPKKLSCNKTTPRLNRSTNNKCSPKGTRRLNPGSSNSNLCKKVWLHSSLTCMNWWKKLKATTRTCKKNFNSSNRNPNCSKKSKKLFNKNNSTSKASNWQPQDPARCLWMSKRPNQKHTISNQKRRTTNQFSQESTKSWRLSTALERGNQMRKNGRTLRRTVRTIRLSTNLFTVFSIQARYWQSDWWTWWRMRAADHLWAAENQGARGWYGKITSTWLILGVGCTGVRRRR